MRLYFDQFRFLCKGTPSQYKKIIESPKNKAGYILQWFNYVEDAFILDEENIIKRNCFDPIKRLNLLQESHFIYICSSLVKPSFVRELNKFLPVYCSVSNFSKKKEKKSKVISATSWKKELSKNQWKKASYRSKSKN